MAPIRGCDIVGKIAHDACASGAAGVVLEIVLGSAAIGGVERLL